jgi:hypothetical protein
MHVVLPKEVIGDNSSGRVDDGDNSLQGEPFVPLYVQEGCEGVRQNRSAVGNLECAGDGHRQRWDVCPRTACGEECKSEPCRPVRTA